MFDPDLDDIMESVLPSREEMQAQQQHTYETSVARQILRKAGYGVGTDRMIAGESGRLTLDKVLEMVELPLWLVAKHVKVGKALDVALENKTTKTSIWAEFQLILDCIPEEFVETRAIGLVFPWAGNTRFKVFHNCDPLSTAKLSHGGRWYRVKGKLYFLENLADALGVWLSGAG